MRSITARLCDGDGLRLLPRPGRPGTAARGRALGRRPGARLALRARRRRVRLGACCGVSSARAARPMRAGCLGLRVKDLTGGFKCFKREVLEAIHFDCVRSQGYAFQVELTYRAVKAGFRGRGGADRLQRPRARPEQDVLADRRRGDVARAEAALMGASRQCPTHTHTRAQAPLPGHNTQDLRESGNSLCGPCGPPGPACASGGARKRSIQRPWTLPPTRSITAFAAPGPP